MKRNDCDDFPDTVIIGNSTLHPLAKGTIQMLILIDFIHSTLYNDSTHTGGGSSSSSSSSSSFLYMYKKKKSQRKL